MGQADQLLRDMERRALQVGALEFLDCPFIKNSPRWHVSPRWITFECGCVAERVRELRGVQKNDPVIFMDPESREFLAIYEKVCHKHLARMNVRISLLADANGHQFRTFKEWYYKRRPLLMGRAA